MSARPRALVIGAGLAGSATTAALLRRGWLVTLLAPGDAPAASSVPAAVMAPTTGRATDPLTRLRRRGIVTTLAWHRRLESAGLDAGRVATGVLLFPGNDRDRLRLQRVARDDRPERRLTFEETHAAAGVRMDGPAVLHPLGGCCRPARLAEAIRAHFRGVGLEIREDWIDRLERVHGEWRLLDGHGRPVATGETVVLAAGSGCLDLWPETRRWLLPARGQATAFAATSATVGLRLPLSGGGYITPAIDGVHWAGATLQRGDADPTPRDADDAANLAFARDRLGLAEAPAAIERFVGFRATTPNRLPLVGRLDEGLWINAGHGAHGLMTAPVCAGLVADAIAGRRHPILRLLDPWRRRDGQPGSADRE